MTLRGEMIRLGPWVLFGAAVVSRRAAGQGEVDSCPLITQPPGTGFRPGVCCAWRWRG